MCPPILTFITGVFELQIFKFWTLLTMVHTIIHSTFLDSLHFTILGFDLYSNELIGMHLGLILWRSYKDLPNMSLGPFCCAELFLGQGLFLEISSSSPSSWSIALCVVDTPWLEIASNAIFLWENRARVVIRSYFTLRWSYPFSGIPHQVRLGPWLRILVLARTKFLQLSIWQCSCRAKALLEDNLPTFLSGFRASSSGCACLSCSQLRPTHWPEAVQLREYLLDL